MADEQPVDVSDYVPTWCSLVAFLGIAGLSLTGNLAVAVSLLLSRRIKGVTSMFMMSLVVSNLMVGLAVTALVMVQIVWPDSLMESACEVPMYIEMVCVTVSVYSLVSVSIDRYVAVVHPTSHILSRRVAAGILVAVWMLGLIYASRLPIINSKADDDTTTTTTTTTPLSSSLTTTSASGLIPLHAVQASDDHMCNFFVEEDEDDLPYRLMDLTVLFFVPFVAMSYMYVCIGKRLWQKWKSQSTMLDRKRQVVKMLVVTIAVFFCCWLPFYALDIVADSLKSFISAESEEEIESDPVYLVIRYVTILLALSNSFITPFIYIYFNEHVKNDACRFFLAVFPSCRPAERPSESSTATAGTSTRKQAPASVSNVAATCTENAGNRAPWTTPTARNQP